MSDNNTAKAGVLFPVFDDATEDINGRKHVIGLATAMSKAMTEYLGTVEDDSVQAVSLGSACFVVAHLTALQFPDGDPRKDQVIRGLVAMLALNDTNNMLSLAPNPPTKDKLN